MKKAISRAIFHISKIEHETIVTVFGIAIEYYVVFLNGYLAPIIISHFFVESSPLIIFSSFILSYIMGPIGAIICGHFGDVYGRKKILSWTIAFVAIPSLFIAILPGYDTIGIYASIIFIFLRSVQMVAIAGDMIGLATFVLEEVKPKRRGLFGGYMSMGASLGVLLASLCTAIFNPYQNSASYWEWRAMTLIGFAGMFVALYFYLNFSETQTFKHYKKEHYIGTPPLRDLIKSKKLLFMKIVGISSLAPIISLTIFGFVPFIGMNYLHLSPSLSMWSNTIALGVFALLAPIFGKLSDKIGRKPILISVSLAYLVLGFPLFYLLDNGNAEMFFIIQVFFSIIASAYYGVTFALCIEQFPTHIRYTGVALSRYITYLLFGGINGFHIMNILIEDIHIEISPVFYLLFGCLLVLISILSIKEEGGHKLKDY